MSAHLVTDLVLLLSVLRCLLASNSTNSTNSTSSTNSSNSSKLVRIIGGDKVAEGDYPYVVHILFEKSRCTGMIIDEEWVLTAAHCIHGPQPVEIFAGGVDFMASTYNSVVVKSTQIIVHPCYNDSEVLDDIALIKVEIPFNFSGCCVKRGILADGLFPTYKNISCTALGYGKTSNKRHDYNTKLYKLPVAASVLEECFRKSAYIYELFNIHPYSYREESGQRICVDSEKDTDTCYGDSGGPLLCKGLLVGVLSYGASRVLQNRREEKPKCAGPNRYSVYMFTGYFMKWIKHHVPNLKKPGVLSSGRTLAATRLLVTAAVGLHVL